MNGGGFSQWKGAFAVLVIHLWNYTFTDTSFVFSLSSQYSVHLVSLSFLMTLEILKGVRLWISKLWSSPVGAIWSEGSWTMFIVHGLPSLYSSVTSVSLPLLIEVGPSALRFPYRTLTWIFLCPCPQDRPACSFPYIFSHSDFPA